MTNDYEDEARVRATVEGGRHRDLIGGLWDELGTLQFNWLVSRGLQPHHKFLDVGCGSGRLAVKAAPYLLPHHYFGQDISASLIEAARGELSAAGCAQRIDGDTFLVSGDFAAPGSEPFDYVLAQSVFTHLPLNQFQQALTALASRAHPETRFFATFFIAAPDEREHKHTPGGIVSYCDRDPFHFALSEIALAAYDAGWRTKWIGGWGHPRNQDMCEFVLLAPD